MSAALDRPVWQALTSRQKAFAEGSGRARRYLDDVAPFAAAADDSAEALADLAALLPPDSKLLLLQVGDCPLPPGVVAEQSFGGVQMVAADLRPVTPSYAVTELTDASAPEMQALALLTRPGPFFPRTHKLGRFIGIRDKGRLVAMAGERMKLDGYTEISAVCTHPEARGRGYASLLISLVAQRIADRGDTPFLHAHAGNDNAIRLYENLGFKLRTAVAARVIRRA